ncbi:hypothetical protein AB0M61_43520 [Streptomyces sp. NPDC051642]|uniref:hypothetical protein n=1 Tax=Streptomyces sp. NPDC051642 TaxID=3154646 RepID=UPI0034410A6C
MFARPKELTYVAIQDEAVMVMQALPVVEDKDAVAVGVEALMQQEVWRLVQHVRQHRERHCSRSEQVGEQVLDTVEHDHREVQVRHRCRFLPFSRSGNTPIGVRRFT